MLDLCSNCGFVAGMPFVIPSSPFERIMCTNRALLGSETERVREIALETENDLTQLEDQIALLHRERDKLRRYVESHKVLLSPIRRLPPEILSEIFLACLTPWNEMLTLAIFDVKSLPWLPGHICSQWRAVALSSPNSGLPSLSARTNSKWIWKWPSVWWKLGSSVGLSARCLFAFSAGIVHWRATPSSTLWLQVLIAGRMSLSLSPFLCSAP
jgi:hypothetical protein